MIGLALSGGGSRAIAFHLGCLRALNDLEILEKIKVLSTVSGGSIIGAYYAYTPKKSFEEFESDIKDFLREGFLSKISAELAKPNNLLLCTVGSLTAKIEGGICYLTKRRPVLKRFRSSTDLFYNVLKRDIFTNLKMHSLRRNNLEVVIGACDLRTASAFRFGNSKSGGWRHGFLLPNDVDVAFAVATSAANPLVFPAFDRTLKFDKTGQKIEQRVILTDGGVYDNLGIQVLEPSRDSNFSLHSFPCDYLISCNAESGQSSGNSIPLENLTRIKRSMEIIHKRVQDLTMHRLYDLKKTGAIKGFILPYLGQIDGSLPWKPGILIPREEVINYPIDFSAMPDEWIDKLSSRGEQLTRALVSYYLSDLIL